MTRFRDTKLYDLLAVAPLMVWYGAGMAGLWPEIVHDLAGFHAGGDVRLGLGALSKMATLAFLGLQIVLFALRQVPVSRSPGWRPRAAALIGANLQLSFLALPQVQLSLPMVIASSIFILLGTAAAIVSVLWLGRGFAIFPQARRLTTDGPYRLVRHPIYLFEQISTLGVMLQFAQPWSALITLASIAAQFPRMHYEEQILGETYPAYRAYAARTKRLIPGVY